MFGHCRRCAGRDCGMRLPPEERTAWLLDRSNMALQVLGNRIFRPDALPEKVAGASTKLLQAIIANADGRLWMLKQIPADMRAHLNERSQSSVSVALVFSLFTQRMGYKPPRRLMQGAARNIEYEADQRRLMQGAARNIEYEADLKTRSSTELGFHLPKRSNKSWYFHHALESNHLPWNAHASTSRAKLLMLFAKRRHKVMLKAHRIALKHMAVRSSFKRK